MKVSILTRISTSSQSNDSSLNELRSICKKKDYDIVEEYVEVVSGSKGKDERSELRRMLSDCKKGKFEKLIVIELSRLGRSLSHLINTLQEMKDSGVEWIGEIPSGWDFKRLGFGIDTIVPMRDKPEDLSGEIPWVRIEDKDGRYITKSKTSLCTYRNISGYHYKYVPLIFGSLRINSCTHPF